MTSDLISDEYLQQQKVLHAAPRGYGGSGHKHAKTVIAYARELRGCSILDYGCGQATLAKEIDRTTGNSGEFILLNYDPAVPEYANGKRIADLVVCTDVLEHIEPDKLHAVLDDIWDHACLG